MLQQLKDRQIENLERQLDQANRVIKELIGALTCPSVEIRALCRDVGLSYMDSVRKNNLES